jgi:hypothetical protein
VITLLAMDFGVTRRFIEVRLKKYTKPRLIPKALRDRTLRPWAEEFAR